jgi:hypothetical protein
MIRKLAFGALLLAAAPLAHAGPFNDTLSVCLVKQTSAAEQTTLVRWIFAAIASHPQVKDMAKLSPQEGEKLNKDVAALYTALLTERCRTETRDAVQYEGEKALESAFETLGKVAMQGLMSDPNVNGYMTGLDKYLDKKKLAEVMPAAAPPPAPTK